MKHNLFRLQEKSILEKPNNLNIRHSNADAKDMAIIGMAGKFPDAPNIDVFWENLKFGKDSSKPFPQNRRRDTDPITAVWRNKRRQRICCRRLFG